MSGIIKRPTDHCEPRKGGAKPSLLILHYTETKDLAEAEGYFLGTTAHPTGGRVSPHYMVDFDGAIYQYVDEEMRAWHAGVSYWDGIADVNSHSIGIEIVNPGHKYGYVPFPVQQMAALVTLCKDILQRHPAITPGRVLAHSDIAPGRKRDPGELFDWQMLHGQGIGAWPELIKEDFDEASLCLARPHLLQKKLSQYGYNPDEPIEAVITAFQRHFCPESFGGAGLIGQADITLARRLCSLVRLKENGAL